jgi:hypothetical protein
MSAAPVSPEIGAALFLFPLHFLGGIGLSPQLNVRSWLPVQRVSGDVVRLADGRLRALLRCRMDLAGLGVLAALPHPAQIVITVRPVPDANSSRARPDHQLFAVVPSGSDTDKEAPGMLNARTSRLLQRLEQAGLRPSRMKGAELDGLTSMDEPREYSDAVQVGHQLARTLIVTRRPEKLLPDLLQMLNAAFDLSFHIVPRRAAGKFALSAYLTLWAESAAILDRHSAQAEALLVPYGIATRRPHLEAAPAFISGLPLSLDLIRTRRTTKVTSLIASISSSAAVHAGERPRP